MSISISNIAWAENNNVEMCKILNDNGITRIDVAPGKLFRDISSVKMDEIKRVKYWWNQRGIELVGMQSLLFGTTGLNLFAENSYLMLDHLENICEIASGLGITKLTFGSPKNRDRLSFNEEQARNIAAFFFRRLADIADSYEVVICLEPNPVDYGCNFMTTTSETAAMVSEVDRPSIRLQLDTGAMFMNNENITSTIEKYSNLVGHIHISEPKLSAINPENNSHTEVSESLKRFLPSRIYTIEMLSGDLIQINNSLKFVMKQYI